MNKLREKDIAELVKRGCDVSEEIMGTVVTLTTEEWLG